MRHPLGGWGRHRTDLRQIPSALAKVGSPSRQNKKKRVKSRAGCVVGVVSKGNVRCGLGTKIESPDLLYRTSSQPNQGKKS